MPEILEDAKGAVTGAPGKVGGGLKKRVGPLPVWGWGVVTVVGLLIGWRLSKVSGGSSAKASASAPHPPSGMPSPGGGFSGAGSGAGAGGSAAPNASAPSATFVPQVTGTPQTPTFPIAPSLPSPIPSARLPTTPAKVEPLPIPQPTLVSPTAWEPDETPGYDVTPTGGIMLDASEIMAADKAGLPYGGWQPTPGF